MNRSPSTSHRRHHKNYFDLTCLHRRSDRGRETRRMTCGIPGTETTSGSLITDSETRVSSPPLHLSPHTNRPSGERSVTENTLVSCEPRFLSPLGGKKFPFLSSSPLESGIGVVPVPPPLPVD